MTWEGKKLGRIITTTCAAESLGQKHALFPLNNWPKSSLMAVIRPQHQVIDVLPHELQMDAPLGHTIPTPFKRYKPSGRLLRSRCPGGGSTLVKTPWKAGMLWCLLGPSRSSALGTSLSSVRALRGTLVTGGGALAGKGPVSGGSSLGLNLGTLL